MFRGSRRQLRAASRLLLLAICVLLLASCRQKMTNQPRYDPLEASDFFPDGMAARPRIEGTVARGDLSGDPFFDTGKINGQIADGFPFPVTRKVVDRGQERFNIYCSECHGRLGDGNGMIPSRGFRRPPSYHTDRMRNQPTGHFFDVMTNGFGAMPKYGTMIPVRDRWEIIAYIRALQLSQNATMDDVPAGERPKLGTAAGPHTDASLSGSWRHRRDLDRGQLFARNNDPSPGLRPPSPHCGETAAGRGATMATVDGSSESASVLPFSTLPSRETRRLVAPLPASSGERVAEGRVRGRAIIANSPTFALSARRTRAAARDTATSVDRMPALRTAAVDRISPKTQLGGAR